MREMLSKLLTSPTNIAWFQSYRWNLRPRKDAKRCDSRLLWPAALFTDSVVCIILSGNIHVSLTTTEDQKRVPMSKRPAEVNLSFLAGLYTRVAKQAGVHPSYVSRVARGERRSEKISQAIAAELAQFVPERGASPAKPSAGGDFRERLVRRLKAHPELSKLSAMVIDAEHWGSRRISQVSRVNLQWRVAKNAPMVAACMEQFHRCSKRFQNAPHIVSLTDCDGIVLYSLGTTGLAVDEGQVPGADWSRDYFGPSVAARAIEAGVPLIIVGEGAQPSLAVRMACPIRLGNGEVAGVVVLAMDLASARAEHLIDMARMSRKVCKIVEKERKKPSRAPVRSPVQPFEEAEVHLARVMAMPQIDQNTRAHLASVLAELEEKRREFLVAGVEKRNVSRKNARAHSV